MCVFKLEYKKENLLNSQYFKLRETLIAGKFIHRKLKTCLKMT